MVAIAPNVGAFRLTLFRGSVMAGSDSASQVGCGWQGVGRGHVVISVMVLGDIPQFTGCTILTYALPYPEDQLAAAAMQQAAKHLTTVGYCAESAGACPVAAVRAEADFLRYVACGEVTLPAVVRPWDYLSAWCAMD